MNVYIIFYLNSDNLIGVVTSRKERHEDEVIELFHLHYPEWTKENLFVHKPVRHIDSV